MLNVTERYCQNTLINQYKNKPIKRNFSSKHSSAGSWDKLIIYCPLNTQVHYVNTVFVLQFHFFCFPENKYFNYFVAPRVQF